ncbi:MAG: radical SAM family heme chaperone HemW [Pseudomonadota bacterium]
MAEDWEAGGFGIYIHWPFCDAKCPYCDFNSHVSRKIDHQAWKQAYIDEIAKAATETPGRVVRSIFFGGGTPSLMKPDTVGAVIQGIQSRWPIANDLEVTLEANPSSVEADRFAAYRDAGVNRVSLGVQSLVDRDLQRLGRLHTAAEARKALDIAIDTFARVSFDLIYGRQDQTLADWETELNAALSLPVDHLSLYQLTIESETAFGARYRAGKLPGLPDDNLGADLYQLTQELCGAAGMKAYEVSNHAKDGAESRHNKIYWQYGDYLGIGPGAHGRLTLNDRRYATEHTRTPGHWLGGSRESVREPLTQTEEAEEFVMMGLRLRDGIDRNRFRALAGRDLPQTAVSELEDQGMISVSEKRISVTDQGFILINEILRQLLAT